MNTPQNAQPREAQLRGETGTVLTLPGTRWLERADVIDERILEHAEGPVLDLGCGPGRHVEALAEKGIAALGIDLSAHAVALARSKGLMVLERSVFDAIPKAGDWGTVLLLDGNIGIGGDPAYLLDHVRSLLRPGGRLLLDVQTNTVTASVERVRLELGDEVGPWFSWAHVDTASLTSLAYEANLKTLCEWNDGDRSFVVLQKPST